MHCFSAINQCASSRAVYVSLAFINKVVSIITWSSKVWLNSDILPTRQHCCQSISSLLKILVLKFVRLARRSHRLYVVWVCLLSKLLRMGYQFNGSSVLWWIESSFLTVAAWHQNHLAKHIHYSSTPGSQWCLQRPYIVYYCSPHTIGAAIYDDCHAELLLI